jgi:predicted GNAT family acetyltransferase
VRPEIEYPDNAGYPDGMGFLDEGTARLAADAGSADLLVPSADAESDLRIIDDPGARVYRAFVDGREVGRIEYRASATGTALISTYVDPILRGQGVATGFIAHVLDERLALGERLTVECPVIRGYIAAHPEYGQVALR